MLCKTNPDEERGANKQSHHTLSVVLQGEIDSVPASRSQRTPLADWRLEDPGGNPSTPSLQPRKRTWGSWAEETPVLAERQSIPDTGPAVIRKIRLFLFLVHSEDPSRSLIKPEFTCVCHFSALFLWMLSVSGGQPSPVCALPDVTQGLCPEQCSAVLEPCLCGENGVGLEIKSGSAPSPCSYRACTFRWST